MIIPWSEKYRAEVISDVLAQEVVTRLLNSFVKKPVDAFDGEESSSSQELQHLLFYGPPGTGKSSAALALCKELFGSNNYKSRVLQVRVNEEGGIDLVRDKIKYFASLRVSNIDCACPGLKVIILDEADSLTFDAQAALRNLIEKFNHNTRFILLCNQPSKIMTAILSRCIRYRFMPIPAEVIRQHLLRICEREGVCMQTADNAISAIVDVSNGDMRRAINLLQGSISDNIISTEALSDLTGLVSFDKIESLLNLADAVRTGEELFSSLFTEVDEVLQQGADVHQILRKITKMLLQKQPKSQSNTGEIFMELAESQVSLKRACDPRLVMCTVLLSVSVALHQSSSD